MNIEILESLLNRYVANETSDEENIEIETTLDDIIEKYKTNQLSVEYFDKFIQIFNKAIINYTIKKLKPLAITNLKIRIIIYVIFEIIGILFTVFGYVIGVPSAIIFIVSFWMILFSQNPDFELIGHSFAISMIGALIATISKSIWEHFSYRRKAAEKTLKNTKSKREIPQKPVLFLRSFRDDNHIIIPTDILPYSEMPEIKTVKLEILINEIFSEFDLSPLIASANPNKIIQTLGFQQLYLPNNVWDRIIKILIIASKFIVVVPNNSRSLIWELEQVLELNCLEKLVFIFPSKEKGRYFGFIEEYRWGNFIRKVSKTRLANLRMPSTIGQYAIIGYFNEGTFNTIEMTQEEFISHKHDIYYHEYLRQIIRYKGLD